MSNGQDLKNRLRSLFRSGSSKDSGDQRHERDRHVHPDNALDRNLAPNNTIRAEDFSALFGSSGGSRSSPISLVPRDAGKVKSSSVPVIQGRPPRSGLKDEDAIPSHKPTLMQFPSEDYPVLFGTSGSPTEPAKTTIPSRPKAAAKGNTSGNNHNHIYIAVMGVTGAGKSTFIAHLAGPSVKIGDQLQSCTSQVESFPYRYNDVNTVHLIDTPGFDDSSKSDFDVLTEIASFVKKTYEENIRLNGLIYLYRISDNRMQGNSMRSLLMFQKLVGRDAYKNVILATTFWELVNESKGAEREEELIGTSNFWGLMRKQGCQVRRQQNTAESARALVSHFVKVQKDNVILKLQRELVDDKKDLIDTAVGQTTQANAASHLAKYRQELRDAKEQLGQALRDRDATLAKMMKAHEKQKVQEMKQRQAEFNVMRQAMEKQLREYSRRHQEQIQKLLHHSQSRQMSLDYSIKPPVSSLSYERRAESGGFEEMGLDSIIGRFLEVRAGGSRPGKQVFLLESEIRALCTKAAQVLMSQSMVLELEAPMKVVGCLHGQYYDLLRLFDSCGYPPESNYLFLGGYVNEGKHSIETMCLLLAYKIKYPENFFILRGNDECASVSRIRGFYDECKRHYNIKLWSSFLQCFNCLPVAAVIDDEIFAVYSGLSPNLNSLEQISRIMRPTDIPDVGLLFDLLWSGPDPDIRGWDKSDQGETFVFGPDVVTRFLKRLDLGLMVRSHQCVANGYEFSANRRLVTLFSAPGHLGGFNKGVVMDIEESLMTSFKIIKPQ